MKRVKVRQDFGSLNIAANEGFKNGVAFRARKLALYTIVGVSAAQSLTAALHLRSADLRFGFRLQLNGKFARVMPMFRLAQFLGRKAGRRGESQTHPTIFHPACY
jgi:hypothetical protein